jgi:hypothetical protein
MGCCRASNTFSIQIIAIKYVVTLGQSLKRSRRCGLELPCRVALASIFDGDFSPAKHLFSVLKHFWDFLFVFLLGN